MKEALIGSCVGVNLSLALWQPSITTIAGAAFCVFILLDYLKNQG